MINKTNEKDADPGVCDSLNKVGTHGQAFSLGWVGGAGRLLGQAGTHEPCSPTQGISSAGSPHGPSRAHDLSVPD